MASYYYSVSPDSFKMFFVMKVPDVKLTAEASISTTYPLRAGYLE